MISFERDDDRTLAQLAQEALDVQTACNMSGVSISFSRAILRLRRLFPEAGTDFYNTHPLTVLWADKIQDLARVSTSKVMEAYNWAEEEAKNKPKEEK